MKALIIDDRKEVSSMIQSALEDYCPQISEITQAHSVASGLTAIASGQPDVVFLDVELGDGTGMDLLKKLEDITFQIVFVTAHDKYALDAFQFAAVDFLLKPIDPTELIRSVHRAEKKLRQQDQLEQLKILNAHMEKRKDASKIVLKNNQAVFFFHLHEIIRCEADGAYTRFFIEDQPEVMVSQGLKTYETLLEPHRFFRTHNSHLVNLDKVRKFDKKEGGLLVMDNGDQVPVSVRRKEALLKALSTSL
jgi:two-component system LytT family response regulator